MSRKSSGEQALELLSEHVERIEQLRNARARDSAFKQWRQGTLTTLQRLWPEDATRADRFRRIPFSSASPKATDRAMHDAYDAGCREARKLLKLWIAEVEHKGLVETDAEKTAPATEMPSKVTPKLTKASAKPATKGKATAKPAAKAMAKPSAKPSDKTKEPSLKSMLDLDGLPETADDIQVPAPAEVPAPQRQRSESAPVARAISALVYELPRLGVPEENREFLRGALLDIANRLEFEELKWTTLQELVFLTMQHPAIGRRILPLIVPYLDKAA